MDLEVARALHVLSIVVWIGGVGLVTVALLPALRGMPPGAPRLAVFEAVERRFRRWARLCVLLAGATGLYMLYRLDAWTWFAEPSGWWLYAMVLIWLIFATVLFVLEPWLRHRVSSGAARLDPDALLRRMSRLHWLLLSLSLLTVAGAVLGSHGVTLFG